MSKPRVGIGILIIQNSRILLGKRKNSLGHGVWATPGGHLEFGETLEECTKRELLEETNLKAESVKKLWFTNDVYAQENKHYVSIFMLVDTISGEIKNNEPHKCAGWQWFDLNNLPSPLFLSLDTLINKEKILNKSEKTNE